MRSSIEDMAGPEQCATAKWYAAYVKHQHERKAADLLDRKQVETFLPLHKELHRWKDRKKTVSLPLFPGYVFLFSDLRNKLQILSTPGVFFLVENAGRACPIPAQEIASIQRIVESGLSAEPHPYINSGDMVRVSSGALAGITGILTRFKNRYRVVLAVELLRKAVSVEVDTDNLERVSGPNARNGPTPSDIRRTA